MIAAKSTPILLSCLKILPETHHLLSRTGQNPALSLQHLAAIPSTSRCRSAHGIVLFMTAEPCV